MKKFIVILASLAMFVMSAESIPAYAQERVEPSSVVQESGGEITPYAEVIVNKYRIHINVLQMRRWNETRGYWVDPAWITISL